MEYKELNRCSSCIMQVLKEKKENCPLRLFNAQSKTELSSFLARSQDQRLKVHFSMENPNFDLVASVVFHSRVLNFIQKSIQSLFSIFGPPTSIQPGHDFDLGKLETSYLAILGKNYHTKDPSKEDRLAAFLIFKTLRDCSLMINIVHSRDWPIHSLNLWRHFQDDVYYSIQLIDMDEKLHTKLSSYLLQYQTFGTLDRVPRSTCFYSPCHENCCQNGKYCDDVQ